MSMYNVLKQLLSWITSVICAACLDEWLIQKLYKVNNYSVEREEREKSIRNLEVVDLKAHLVFMNSEAVLWLQRLVNQLHSQQNVFSLEHLNLD